jgi:antitoxin CcdA
MSNAFNKPSTAKPTVKRATTVRLSTDVYLAAKALELDISQLCEQRLRAEIQRAAGKEWQGKYVDFIAAYNKKIASEDVALQQWRAF